MGEVFFSQENCGLITTSVTGVGPGAVCVCVCVGGCMHACMVCVRVCVPGVCVK